MDESNDYYKLLGVDKNAKHDEIKKAYRRLSLENHPDKNGGNEEATNKFKLINEAWGVLQDDNKRKQYDMEKLFGIDSTNTTNVNPEDILNQIFGGGGGGGGGIFSNLGGGGIFNGMPRSFDNVETHFFHVGENGIHRTNPTAIIKKVKISIQDAYTGCNIPIEIERWIQNGNTKTRENETLYVKIPKGIDENEIIVLKEKGNIYNDINKGDVKIFLLIDNKTDYTRVGLDLVYQKSITLKEALCGFSFNMKYIDGRNFQINNGVGNIITPNYKKIIPKMGMERDDNVGNLIIEFTIIFPESLSNEKVDILKDNL
tara:strand:+ start:3401 stop:4345 length:945 start_codon:yes stop_codon:yes gene_type:complete